MWMGGGRMVVGWTECGWGGARMRKRGDRQRVLRARTTPMAISRPITARPNGRDPGGGAGALTVGAPPPRMGISCRGATAAGVAAAMPPTLASLAAAATSADALAPVPVEGRAPPAEQNEHVLHLQNLRESGSAAR